MTTQPDLQQPFANDSERARELAAFLEACIVIERWLGRAADPASMSEDERAALRDGLQSGDSPELKLKRWASLFADEIRVVMDARNRVVHGIRLTDAELRGARWLADHLAGMISSRGAA